MWWRALGVAAVLLCVGLAGGYALADRTQDQPQRAAEPEPLPASPLPTPQEFDVLPDPDTAALEPGLPGEQRELRLTRRGAGISLQVPAGWTENRLPNSDTWTYVGPENISNTYYLRVRLMIGDQLAATVAKSTRVAALQSAEDEGNIEGLEVTAETTTSFEATYIVDGYRKVTGERWVATESGTAYADVAVTGRVVDTEGLRDLLAKTAGSVTYLDPLAAAGAGAEQP
jgi:hypothetical protein